MASRRDPETGLCLRGTSNRDDRGSAEQRRRRAQWLVKTYRADVDVVVVPRVQVLNNDPPHEVVAEAPLDKGVPACRCFRCGKLMTAQTLTVDRIKPKCEGGTYHRTNIRPACDKCNSETGGALAAKKTPAKKRAKKVAAAKKAPRLTVVQTKEITSG